MEYKLKNGKTVLIRKPVEDDAEAIINVITTADTESPFLARNPGEFQMTAEELRKSYYKCPKEQRLYLVCCRI